MATLTLLLLLLLLSPPHELECPELDVRDHVDGPLVPQDGQEVLPGPLQLHALQEQLLGLRRGGNPVQLLVASFASNSSLSSRSGQGCQQMMMHPPHPLSPAGDEGFTHLLATLSHF